MILLKTFYIYSVSAKFSGTDLNDGGLFFISNFIELESLDLQDTQITNKGIKHLKKLVNLTSLRLKDNPQLTNDCVADLVEIVNLKDLQIHETSINQNGLKKLIKLQNLENIILEVFNGNYTFEGLLEISKEKPNCNILAKSKAFGII